MFKKETNPILGFGVPNEADYLVKRVIGLPGDRITVKNGVITVYNAANPDGFNPDANQSWSKDLQYSRDDSISVTLEPGELFVSGDNRPESIDSRSYGGINADNIVGQVIRF